jgi:lysophospholipase L1-like esterase
MKANTFIFAALVVIGALVAQGCADSAPSGPSASLGSVSVTKYVAIGNSLTAGYQSNGLYQSAQIYSYPNLISQQLNAAGANLPAFQQPLWPDPGSPDPTTGKASRFELISLTGPVVGPAGEALTAAGPPSAMTLQRPYDNLGIPGAVIYDFLDTTNFLSKEGAPRNNGFFLAILRSSAIGNSILAQATAATPLKADLVTFWLGANDVLGYATSGGTSPSAPTSATIFTGLYSESLGQLHAALPNAKILVANIPDVDAIPFFTTIGPKIGAALKGLEAVNHAVVGLFYEKSGEMVASSFTNFTNPSTDPLITLKGGPYAALLGQPTGQWYHDLAAATGFPFAALYASYSAAGIDTTQPFGLDPRNPFPDALVLDAGEQAIAAAAITSFNATIASVAAANGAAVVDMNGFFNTIKTSGLEVDGETFTTAYIAGNLFSLDGVHPSSKGYGIVANEYIKTMNASFGMHVPLVNINSLPGIPTVQSLSKLAGDKNIPVIPYSAWKSFDALWGSGR